MGELKPDVSATVRTLIRSLRSVPLLGDCVVFSRAALSRFGFRSAEYWDRRYRNGFTSGSGSYGELSRFKAEVINRFVAEHSLHSVVEFGCGDGHQLSLSRYPKYLGLDVSRTAVDMCGAQFRSDPTKSFGLLSDKLDTRADLALSLDVIYHLVEDSAFESHMRGLFESAKRYVIIYSDNAECLSNAGHVRHRCFSRWIERNAPAWWLVEHIVNTFPYDKHTQTGSWSDFWIYGR
jgi:hypothetical protein